KKWFLSPTQARDLLTPHVQDLTLDAVNEAFQATWDEDHRLVMESRFTFIPSMVFIVSIIDSPFFKLLVEAEKLIKSALSLFAAISKEFLVLVLGSKKRFAIVFPLKVGTFFTFLSRTSIKEVALFSIKLISSLVSPSISIMLFPLIIKFNSPK
ncbi:MAG: hypothetical protein R6U35_05985, partial [Candidatus Humimicrobiaceae bacterium]